MSLIVGASGPILDGFFEKDSFIKEVYGYILGGQNKKTRTFFSCMEEDGNVLKWNM
jgi:hypothetical protein